MARYSNRLRNKILHLHQKGWSSRQIADQFHKDPSNIRRFIRTFATRTSLAETQRRGRKPLLTDRDKRVIKYALQSGECETEEDIAKQAANIGLPEISSRSVRRVMHELLYRVTKKTKKPLLSRAHKALRLEWARAHQHWTFDDWKKVVFSDECVFRLVDKTTFSWFWRGPEGNPFVGNHVIQTVKHPPKIPVWGCMSYQGVGYMCCFEKNLNQSIYQEILEDHLNKSIPFVMPKHLQQTFLLQHDNDTKHTARATQKWLNTHAITQLGWPPQSPDLNPMEHVWARFKNRVRSGPRLANKTALWERMEQEWWKIEKSFCYNLIKSMPDRVKAVIQAKGGHTKY